jgi:hypothetical protein
VATKEQSSNALPGWVKEDNEKTERQKRDADKQARDERETTKLVQAGSPDFWRRFVASLESNADALAQLHGSQWHGKASPEDATAISPKMSCHVEVIRHSSDPSGPWSRRMRFDYLPGSTVIQRWYENTQKADIDLQPGRTGIMAEVDGESPKTAEALGEHIVRKLKELVEKNKN